jgi:Cu(I)/Ag(I) efflux system membrane protein CusA/SilA
MIGGLFTSFLMELLVYPAIYLLWKWHEVKKAGQVPQPTFATRETVGG